MRSFSALKVHDWIFRLTSDYYKEEEALRTLKGYTNSVIEKKIKALGNTTIHTNDIDKKKRLAFLDLLLEKRAEVSDELLSNSVEGLMFAVSFFFNMYISKTCCKTSFFFRVTIHQLFLWEQHSIYYLNIPMYRKRFTKNWKVY